MILNVQRSVLLGLIIGLPLVVTPSLTLDPFNIPKFALLVAGCSLVTALWAVQVLLGRSPVITRRDLIVPAVMILPLFVGWLFSSYRTWAAFGQYSRLQGLVPYALLALFAIELAVLLRGRAHRIAWALAVAGGLVGLAQLGGVIGLSPTGGFTDASTIGNSNFVGGFLAVTFPLALHLWWSRDQSQRREKLGAIGLTVLIGEGLILSFSEGAQSAAIVGAALLGAAHLKGPGMKALLIGVAAVIPLALLASVTFSRLHAVAGPTATSRSYAWQSAWSLAKQSPLVGYGPNAFALEGSKQRSLEDVLAHRGLVPGFTPLQVDHQVTDDPHSVPLSFLVSAGAVGLLGFLLAALWLAREAIRRRSGSKDPTLAFGAALAAYFAQSVLTVDELPLRIAFWACVGGLLAGLPVSARKPTGEVTRPTTLRTLGAGMIFSVFLGSGAFLGFSFFRADQLARAGSAAFAAGEPRLGEARLREALALRGDATYKQILAEHLGIAALEGEPGGARMIAEMRSINRYLVETPDAGALHAFARILNYWGEHDPSADASALLVYERAQSLDPNNPLILIERAETLADLGRAAKAQEILEPRKSDLQTAMPAFWGALAITRLENGDSEGAKEALAVGMGLDPGDCRVSMAKQLLDLTSGAVGTPDDPGRLHVALACDPGLYARFLEQSGLGES